MTKFERECAVRAVVSDALITENMQPCTDGSCIFGPPGGMHTNGGCQCIKEAARSGPIVMSQVVALASVIRTLAAVIVDGAKA